MAIGHEELNVGPAFFFSAGLGLGLATGLEVGLVVGLEMDLQRDVTD